ncbi:MAG: hypothetical protein WAN66_13755 [Limnoraphis robusta]|uniref:Ferritin-like diiron domain-containing protein n=1 Tax=Limnoraphis robusta CS-951 TaxID=1637645 RepID=A0A0F5YIP5_9CYAN|nr:hypothetical protein [Limnoraphis robusta]KKD38040.1 hypothetical protein WN50_11035 [Limnoraphis robusta CS-951]
MVATGNSKAVSDLEYDLIALLKNKSEAVQIYNTYIEDAQNTDSDACVELFKKLQQQERQQAEEVRRHLQEVMQKGKM